MATYISYKVLEVSLVVPTCSGTAHLMVGVWGSIPIYDVDVMRNMFVLSEVMFSVRAHSIP